MFFPIFFASCFLILWRTTFCSLAFLYLILSYACGLIRHFAYFSKGKSKKATTSHPLCFLPKVSTEGEGKGSEVADLVPFLLRLLRMDCSFPSGRDENHVPPFPRTHPFPLWGWEVALVTHPPLRLLLAHQRCASSPFPSPSVLTFAKKQRVAEHGERVGALSQSLYEGQRPKSVLTPKGKIKNLDRIATLNL